MTAVGTSTPSFTGRVSDFVWRDGQRADLAALRLDQPGELWGQFALHQDDGRGGHWLVRDRLGVNKLFFTVTAAGDVVSSNYVADLRRRGHRLADIWSVPSGHSLRLAPGTGEYRLQQHAVLAYDGGANTDTLVANIRGALAATFDRLRTLLHGRRVFVTLSGGLDSTVVALLAREHLGDVTGVTFAMAGDDGSAGGGSDLRFARLVADRLQMPLELVQATGDEIVQLLDTVLLYGQDWRDFNVHCGLVNAAIGWQLRARLGDPAGPARPVLLTGDTMNELLADYRPVVYRDVTYYALPKVPMQRLRRFLVSGLDSGDREVGILHAFGFDVVQPFALAAEAYAAVPSTALESPQAKQDLVRAVMGTRVPAPIYDRPKVRAQAGATEVGGTLAALADRGIDSARLLQRFAELLDNDAREVQSLVRAGMYRFATRAPWLPPS